MESIKTVITYLYAVIGILILSQILRLGLVYLLGYYNKEPGILEKAVAAYAATYLIILPVIKARRTLLPVLFRILIVVPVVLASLFLQILFEYGPKAGIDVPLNTFIFAVSFATIIEFLSIWLALSTNAKKLYSKYLAHA